MLILDLSVSFKPGCLPKAYFQFYKSIKSTS